MNTLRVILADQLSETLTSLEDAVKSKDWILLCEVEEEATYVRHHKKKLAFLFSAMRHFAKELQEKGFQVLYTKLDDPENRGSLFSEVERVLNTHPIDQIVLTHPGEYRLLKEIDTWEEKLNVPVEVRPDTRFLCSTEEFGRWARGRKQLRMENFYREMRKKHSILMENGQPVGGEWNYDSENRKPPKEGLQIPSPFVNKPDEITKEVIELISKRFDSHFGDLEPFYFAVTRKQALSALKLFVEERLPSFGDYQDAMVQNEPWMYHSHLSFYLNTGLLLPLECIQAAEDAYQAGKVPLNATEGFIRQILGWREFVRGIYWLKMPSYAEKNYLQADRKLPEFFWTGETKMNCLKQCVLETKQNAYAHHIQRLMVLGNFALLAGIHPDEVNEWYLIVYADAFEWVEMPNVTGMILFADGGYLASKPYAASGNYIHKMSDYCKNCTYKVSKKSGEEACPFNYLYWNFIGRNRKKLETNHRMQMMYRTYDRMSEEKKSTIERDSEAFFNTIEKEEPI